MADSFIPSGVVNVFDAPNGVSETLKHTKFTVGGRMLDLTNWCGFKNRSCSAAKGC